MNRQRTGLVVAALIRRGAEVLLVRQQGPDDPEPGWALPGGVVEAGELLIDALSREVREETGLTAERVGPIACVVQVHDAVSGEQWAAVTFEIDRWHGEPAPADPDGLILEVEFLTPAEAAARLEALPWRRMREPVVAYLRGEAERGSLWCYRRQPDGEETLVVRSAER
jgi:8-oxo-dGTP diphosphatase